MHDVADFTSSLIEWAGDSLSGLKVRAASARDVLPAQEAEIDVVLVRLAAVECSNGPRSRDAVSRRLKLVYRFDVSASEPVAEHQALADLAFALSERSDLAEGHELIRGEHASIVACFTIDRRNELPQAKPVREAVFDLHANARISGCVRAEDDVPLSKARIHVLGTNQLIIADHDGGFTFAAPEGASVRARVSAKGRSADIELKTDRPNLITLVMER